MACLTAVQRWLPGRREPHAFRRSMVSCGSAARYNSPASSFSFSVGKFCSLTLFRAAASCILFSLRAQVWIIQVFWFIRLCFRRPQLQQLSKNLNRINEFRCVAKELMRPQHSILPLYTKSGLEGNTFPFSPGRSGASGGYYNPVLSPGCSGWRAAAGLVRLGRIHLCPWLL